MCPESPQENQFPASPRTPSVPVTRRRQSDATRRADFSSIRTPVWSFSMPVVLPAGLSRTAIHHGRLDAQARTVSGSIVMLQFGRSLPGCFTNCRDIPFQVRHRVVVKRLGASQNEANRRSRDAVQPKSTENKCPTPFVQPDPSRRHAILASSNQCTPQPFGAPHQSTPSIALPPSCSLFVRKIRNQPPGPAATASVPCHRPDLVGCCISFR